MAFGSPLLVPILALAMAANGSPVYAAVVFTVNAAWVRPASAGKTTQAYLTLTSSEDSQLIGAESPRAASVTLNAPKSPGAGTVSLALHRGIEVEFAPGKLHFTLHQVRQRLKRGDHVPLMLIVQSTTGALQSIPVNAEVRDESPIEAELKHQHKAGPSSATQ